MVGSGLNESVYRVPVTTGPRSRGKGCWLPCQALPPPRGCVSRAPLTRLHCP